MRRISLTSSTAIASSASTLFASPSNTAIDGVASSTSLSSSRADGGGPSCSSVTQKMQRRFQMMNNMGVGGGGTLPNQYRKANPFSSTSTTVFADQPAQPTIPAPIHPDFEVAMSKEVRKKLSCPHPKGPKASSFFDEEFSDASGKKTTSPPAAGSEEKDAKTETSSNTASPAAASSAADCDFAVEPPMNKHSGLAAGASKKEDASQGVAAAVASLFENEQRHEELRKTTTRIIDKRRLVVDKETGEVISRRSEAQVKADEEKQRTAERKKKASSGFFHFLTGKKDKAERQKEAERQKSLKVTTNLDDDEKKSTGEDAVDDAADPSSYAPSSTALGSAKGKAYRFFEDQYPKEKPSEAEAKRYAYYEEMERAAKVKCHEDKGPGPSESEKLHKAHAWKETREGMVPDETYGWAEEWGPEPGEEGHSEWYKKNRMYMSYEEKSRLDLKNGVPLEKNQFRHHEMPVQKKMKAAYERMSEETGGPEMYGMNERGYDASHTYEEKRDFIMAGRDDYMKEWLAKPGVTPENMAKKIGEYNGTAKKKNVVPVQRKPEWEIAPIVEE